jgi:hypothetical protein
MSVYWITVVGTLYIIGFLIPFFIQLFFEKSENKNKYKLLKFKSIKQLCSFYHKKDLIKSLSHSCFILGIMSVVLANLTMLLLADTIQNKFYSLFIGLWAPTLISVGIYLKSNESRKNKE